MEPRSEGPQRETEGRAVSQFSVFLLGIVIYIAPLFCGRACIPVGVILWPVGLAVMAAGVFNGLGSVSA